MGFNPSHPGYFVDPAAQDGPEVGVLAVGARSPQEGPEPAFDRVVGRDEQSDRDERDRSRDPPPLLAPCGRPAQGAVGPSQPEVPTDKPLSGPGLARSQVASHVHSRQHQIATSQGQGRRALRLRQHVNVGGDAPLNPQGTALQISTPGGGSGNLFGRSLTRPRCSKTCLQPPTALGYQGHKASLPQHWLAHRAAPQGDRDIVSASEPTIVGASRREAFSEEAPPGAHHHVFDAVAEMGPPAPPVDLPEKGSHGVPPARGKVAALQYPVGLSRVGAALAQCRTRRRAL